MERRNCASLQSHERAEAAPSGEKTSNPSYCASNNGKEIKEKISTKFSLVHA
jgi:hypothetical protein